MRLANGPASYFGQEGPTSDIPGTCNIESIRRPAMWDGLHASGPEGACERGKRPRMRQHAGKCCAAAAQRRLHHWPSTCKASLPSCRCLVSLSKCKAQQKVNKR